MTSQNYLKLSPTFKNCADKPPLIHRQGLKGLNQATEIVTEYLRDCTLFGNFTESFLTNKSSKYGTVHEFTVYLLKRRHCDWSVRYVYYTKINKLIKYRNGR